MAVAMFGVEAFGNVSLAEFCEARGLSDRTIRGMTEELRLTFGIYRPQSALPMSETTQPDSALLTKEADMTEHAEEVAGPVSSYYARREREAEAGH